MIPSKPLLEAHLTRYRGVDFDDTDYGFKEEGKDAVKVSEQGDLEHS